MEEILATLQNGCVKNLQLQQILFQLQITLETRITTNKGELHLQEYWVKHRGKDPVEGIQYIGAEKARPNPEAINAIHDADMVILAPGNPLTSIGPMLQLKGIRKELSKIKKKVVAVSPLIGEKSISGPADKIHASCRN